MGFFGDNFFNDVNNSWLGKPKVKEKTDADYEKIFAEHDASLQGKTQAELTDENPEQWYRQQKLDDLYRFFGDKGGDVPQVTDNGAGSGYASGVNSQFDGLKQQLDARNATAQSGIDANHGQYNQSVNKSYDMYKNDAASMQGALSQRIAEAMASANNEAKTLGSYATARGLDAQPIEAQGQANASTLKTSGSLQQDLAQRLAQVASQSHDNWTSSGDLVNQGAQGMRQNTYLSAQNDLEAQRQSALTGGGGGGGGGSDKTTADERKQANLQSIIDRAWKSGNADSIRSALTLANPDYAVYAASLNEDQQGAAIASGLEQFVSPDLWAAGEKAARDQYYLDNGHF